jgi:hypothetical protein
MNNLQSLYERPRPRTVEASEAGAPVAVERHVGPFADGSGVVVKKTSDDMFGPNGIGFASSPWMKLVSWLARNGISDQTGSRPNETIVKNCGLGWGQGAYSSHVFQPSENADAAALERLISSFQRLALALEGHPDRITARVAAAWVNNKPPEPYSTHEGLREARTWTERAASRFRAHIQWQSLVTLCGHVDQGGRRVLTRPLLTRFFAGEGRFFAEFVERRRKLLSGELQAGAAVGLLENVDGGIDRVATDEYWRQNKSSLRLILGILWHMAVRTGRDA